MCRLVHISFPFLTCHLCIHVRCLAYGVLSHKKSEKLLAIVNERKKKKGLGTTVSSPAPPKKKKVKIVKDEAVDPDMQKSSGAEGMGSVVI